MLRRLTISSSRT